jgi:multidrug efflux pump
MTGALGLLQWTGGTLNVYSQIGLITLVGLITKHGILIVEFANQLRDQGKSIRDSVVEGAALRLRPILMTTGAMVLGALPLALAHGAGSESRIQIGMVIVGGMTLGTILTLFVVPTFYTLLTSRHRDSSEKSDLAMAESTATPSATPSVTSSVPSSATAPMATGVPEMPQSPESPRAPTPGPSPAAGS